MKQVCQRARGRPAEKADATREDITATAAAADCSSRGRQARRAAEATDHLPESQHSGKPINVAGAPARQRRPPARAGRWPLIICAKASAHDTQKKQKQTHLHGKGARPHRQGGGHDAGAQAQAGSQVAGLKRLMGQARQDAHGCGMGGGARELLMWREVMY